MSSPEVRQSELDELLKVTDKYLDRDKAREKARLVAIFKNEVASSKQFASPPPITMTSALSILSIIVRPVLRAFPFSAKLQCNNLVSHRGVGDT